MSEKLPAMLIELAGMVSITLPFIEITEAEVENVKTSNKFTGITFEYKNQEDIKVGFCTGLSMGIDGDAVIFAIHCAGVEDKVMQKPVDQTNVEELHGILHQAFVHRIEIS